MQKCDLKALIIFVLMCYLFKIEINLLCNGFPLSRTYLKFIARHVLKLYK